MRVRGVRVHPTTDLRPGDILARPKLPLVAHYGVCIGAMPGRTGCWVLHNSFDAGCVVLEPLEKFASGARVYVAWRPAPGEVPAVVRRALGQLGQRYDLLQYNCEHTTTLALAGTAYSPQLRQAVGMGLVALGLIALTR